MPKILVIGDTILDRYLHLLPIKISNEAPVIIQQITNEHVNLGGGANIARNLAALDNEVTYCGLVSKETESLFTRLFAEQKIHGKVYVVDGCISVKTRMISNGQQTGRFDSSTHVDEETILKIQKKLKKYVLENLNKYDCVVISKYLDFFLTTKFINTISLHAKKSNIPVILDNRFKDTVQVKNISILKLNYFEFKNLLTHPIQDTETLIFKELKLLRSKLRFDNIIITRANESTIWINHQNEIQTFDVQSCQVVDATGAGDTFLSVLATYLKKFDLAQCVQLANTACSLVIKKPGTSMIDLHELSEVVGDLVFHNLKDDELIFKKIANLKNKNKKIVFVNGVFDLLHSGHVELLTKAKALGDVLVIGINSDKSVKKIKGETRPINELADRMQVLSAIKYVDYLIPFDETDASQLLEKIQPDVYAKGVDYTLASIVEKAALKYCKEVVFIKTSDRKTTSKIIDSIKKLS